MLDLVPATVTLFGFASSSCAAVNFLGVAVGPGDNDFAVLPITTSMPVLTEPVSMVSSALLDGACGFLATGVPAHVVEEFLVAQEVISVVVIKIEI